MTKEQREILVGLVEAESDAYGYTIVTVEFPASMNGDLKVVTKQYDPTRDENFLYVDIYNSEGRTISTESRPVT